jgi:glycosyltransferase involved in cell wall biosynthesis
MIWEAREVIEKMLNDDKTLKAQRNKKAFIANLIKKNGGNFYAKRTLDQLVQFLADIVVFGGFDPCPKCRNANFYYRYALFIQNYILKFSLDRRVYQCAGFGKEGKCVYYSREIKRKPFKAEGIAALSKYDGKQVCDICLN